VKSAEPSVERSEGPWAKAAACSAQGPRPTNEDVHVLICDGLPAGPAPNVKAAGLPGLFDDLPSEVSGPSLPQVEKEPQVECLWAVFDGHGGAAASFACAARIPTEIREELEAAGRDTAAARKIAVESTYLALDRHLRVKLGPLARDVGTTCVFCLAWQEESHVGILLANLGDSRALLLKKKGAGHELAAATSDHVPNAPEEERRIREAGGKVEVFPGSRVPVPRVDGLLGCSRALGDLRFKEDAALTPEKQKVSNIPDIYEYTASSGDVVVLCCDGVFDVLASKQVTEIVSSALAKSGDAGAAAEAVVRKALADPRQQDNVTCVVAVLK